MKMKIKTTNFSDLRKFANVVFLIDRNDFLEDIHKLRTSIIKETGVNLPLPWESGMKFSSKLWKPMSMKQINLRAKVIKKADEDYFEAVRNIRKKQLPLNVIEKYEKAWRLNPQEGFHLDVRKMRLKYKQFIFMEKVISKAIIYNEINEDDYSDCEARILLQEREYPFLEPDPLLSIVITPSTNEKELLIIYREKLPKLREEYISYGLAPKYPAIKIKPKDEIIRDRNWYWLNRPKQEGGSGLSYLMIAKEESKRLHNDPYQYKDTIRKAINHYKEMLTTHLTET